MATYAVGDIQGCYETFLRLLDRIDFDPAVDRLWVAGDLVNRGPRSADVLRWMVEHDACVSAVLGNHEVHLLRRAEGHGQRRALDTLDDILEAPDRDRLLGWLINRPLVVHDEGRVLVHAGLLPAWTLEDVIRRARAAEALLRGPERAAFVARLGPSRERTLPVPEAWVEPVQSVGIMTNLRMVDAAGRPYGPFKGPPEEAPSDTTPWFAVVGRPTADLTVFFGHWATLGFYRAPGAVGLDSGCVWGNRLTAVRLDDDAIFQAPLADAVGVAHPDRTAR